MIPGFSWVANKECHQQRPKLFPASDSICGHCPSAEKDAEELEQPEEDGTGQLPESDAVPRWLRHHRGETREGRKSQHHRALNAGSGLQGDPIPNIKTSSITGHLKSSLVTEKTLPQESFVSQVPLRLQIKVSSQSGSLGISIAGGKGSLPYKDQDEVSSGTTELAVLFSQANLSISFQGIFISRVNKEGASGKAGVHVGDRLLEVNGLNMQAATHHEAVSSLRNAGSCIKMKVLREKLLPREVCDLDEHQDPLDVIGRQPCTQDGRDQRGKQPKTERVEDGLSKKIEAVVCNGSSISDLMKHDSLQGGKHTMTIPRIILTHPSISDEDVELWTQTPSREPLHDCDIPDRQVYCSDNAFYPP
ncbi:PDZ domain-containing protein 7 isoform X1 [Sander lucioperca]|uniref:PDZ domain-containing protein 7 isoform X1 n=1 Tax=Sander lucioperca TaxID=283035 RepID=UPI00125D8D31|nr:PDZ domain-containing protein 7 isoform X1 [Sander lucioperca]